MRRSLALALVPALILAYCGGARAETPSQIYARACIEAIGTVPAFSCADGVVIPVTIDGKPASAPTKICDRPALLDNGADSDGQCVPNSRILSLSTKAAQIAVMCRRKHNRPSDLMTFDEIDVVAHNPATGATCWFQAGGNGGTVEGAKVPSPTDGADGFWRPPSKVAEEACGTCHTSGPFMFSPFVGQGWKIMPADPFGPYRHVDPASFGFAMWPTDSIAPRDNACIGCHRIGTGKNFRDLSLWMTGRAAPAGADDWALKFPASHTMPPEIGLTETAWTTVYEQSLDELLICWETPGAPDCGLEMSERRNR